MAPLKHGVLCGTQHIQLYKAPLGACKEDTGSLRALGLHGRVLDLRTGLTFAIHFPTGDQEQQDSSSFGCAGCQPHPGSAAAGAATGRPAGLCQHEGGGPG